VASFDFCDSCISRTCLHSGIWPLPLLRPWPRLLGYLACVSYFLVSKDVSKLHPGTYSATLVPMNKLNQARSPRALYDLELIEGTVVAVVELKRIEGVMASHWWVSGLTEDGKASLLLQLQTGLTSLNEKGALVECQQMKPIILKLAKKSALAGGLKSALVLPEASDRTAFALAHMRLLEQASLLGDRQSELSVRTSRQYELCKSFGITSAVQFISDFEQVPISTIRRRLAKARDRGFIKKTRKLAGQNNGN